jgi:hypothetical protein
LPETTRRSLPDNLDPLVDTLSNVVGILVVVVALTQLQVGDALDRLIELDASQRPGAHSQLTALEAQHAALAERLADGRQRREAVLARSAGNIEDAIAAAEAALERLEGLPKRSLLRSPQERDRLERRVAEASKRLAAQEASLRDRKEYATEIQKVPRELVARLPDPGLVTGEENWILCRYGRCYLADRTKLIQAGSRAIGKALAIDEIREVRPDEFESVAHHFRKRDIGDGNFRWKLVLEPQTRARLEWRSKDAGIDRTQLATSRALQSWLAARSPERDFIRFQVWNDSFEAYLEARQVIEAAGFRAGWDGFEADTELDLFLTFGRPLPIEGPVEVD